MPSKPCSAVGGNECSNLGTCVYVDHKAEMVLDSCLLDDQDCFAYCKCQPGYYGKACELSHSEYI